MAESSLPMTFSNYNQQDHNILVPELPPAQSHNALM